MQLLPTYRHSSEPKTTRFVYELFRYRYVPQFTLKVYGGNRVTSLGEWVQTNNYHRVRKVKHETN